MHRSISAFWLSQLLSLFFCVCPLTAQDTPAQPDAVDTENAAHRRSDVTTTAPLLRRLIRSFTFEEIIEQPYLMPIAFERIHDRPGFKPFGRMGFSNVTSAEGEWSFHFQLDGGSMAAAVGPKEIPIIPGGQYLVTAWVKTRDLTAARTRITARLVDQTSNFIKGSVRRSDLIQTDDEWQQIFLTIPGNFEDASSIILELEVLQPRETLIEQPDPAVPLLEDVAGDVWFDDIAIWHLPTMQLSTGRPHEIVIAPELPRLEIDVKDLASEPMDARLVVTNLADDVMHKSRFMLSRGSASHLVDLRGLPFGWYQAAIELRNGSNQLLGAQEIAFLYMPPPSPMAEQQGFGINLETIAMADIAPSASLIDQLNLPLAILPTWDRAYEPSADEVAIHNMRNAVDELLDQRIEIIFAIATVPELLARALHIDSDNVNQLFNEPDENLQRFLEPILVHFGQRVRHWQIGATRDVGAAQPGDRVTALQRADAALAQLVPGPSLVLPTTADELNPPPADKRHTVLPYAFDPLAISLMFEQERTLPAEELELQTPLPPPPGLVTLETLPAEYYGSEQRVIDLAMRTLQARRANLPQIMIEDPWSMNGSDAQPAATLGPWLTLARFLSRRTFEGEVPIGSGLQCWLFEGGNGPILVAWNETAPSHRSRIDVELADGPIVVTDLFGNETTIDYAEGRHTIELTNSPIFMTGIDANLARFRQGFRITPDHAPSVQRLHQHELIISNPWNVTMTGSVKFLQPRNWRFGPRRLRFSIPPNGSARLPFSLSFSRMEVAGLRRIESLVEFESTRPFSFRMSSDFELGLEGLELISSWRLSRNQNGELRDIVVSAHISNTGDRPLNLDAFVLAPGFPRNNRTISRLQPGDTAVKTFYLANGAERLPGQTVLVGVGELDSTARLNRRIDIPIEIAVPESVGD